MLRPLLFAVLLGAGLVPTLRAPAAGSPAAGVGKAAPFVRVPRGAALLRQGLEARSLGPLAGEVELAAGPASLEAGAHTELELAWRGRASARIAGPAQLALTGEPRLRLSSFQSVELEVRRGPLTLEAPGLFAAELGGGAVRLGALAGGAVEILNRGGEPLEIRPAGAPRATTLAPGQSLRLRAPRP